MSALTYDELIELNDGRRPVIDVPCPLCSPFHNPLRKVLRVWCDIPRFIRYHCIRCGTKGWAHDGVRCKGQLSSSEREAVQHLRCEAERREHAESAKQLDKARWLWSKSHPAAGSIVEQYLRECRHYRGPIPSTLHFVSPHKAEHHPAMIAAFGIPSESTPGMLDEIWAHDIAGVHLTLLRPDGSEKADISPNKIMVGKSGGSPLVLAPPNDLLGLLVTEGIEDALSLHEATGLGAWAAGSASRMPALAPAIPSYAGAITVVMDADPAGRTNASLLAVALRNRGFFVEILPPQHEQRQGFAA
ncbi:MAG TPA: toprim domain-containing protein [Microvirga sp.]|jgi:hypothetical protein|nr:toprim domain-containing protein [Microvirga sp.]